MWDQQRKYFIIGGMIDCSFLGNLGICLLLEHLGRSRASLDPSV